MATRLPQRCSLIQLSEEDEISDSVAPAKEILFGILISMAFWMCLGLALWRSDSVRCKPWPTGKLASFVHSAAGNDRNTDRHCDH